VFLLTRNASEGMIGADLRQVQRANGSSDESDVGIAHGPSTGRLTRPYVA
jgi:hypothetical protein